jgi:hypothetical protein
LNVRGFTLIANLGEKTQIIIQGMSTHELAEAFAGQGKFMAAAHVGKAIQEARQMERTSDLSKLAEDLFGVRSDRD